MIRQVSEKEWECTIDDAVTLVELFIDQNDPVMIWGDTGLGKTSITDQIAKRRGWKNIISKSSIREPVDVRGIPVPDLEKGVTRWLTPVDLPQADRDGEEGLYTIDEINHNIPMMPVYMMIALERKIAEYNFPAGWRIVATGNRVSDRAGAQKMPTALANRFAHITIVPDVDAWCQWATLNAIAPEYVAFIRFRREFIHLKPDGEAKAFPTPRSHERAAKYVNAPKRLRIYAMAAHVGYACAAEADAFIELYRAIGSLDDIVKNPDSAPVPTEPSLRYATCTALAKIADRKTIGNIIR